MTKVTVLRSCIVAAWVLTVMVARAGSPFVVAERGTGADICVAPGESEAVLAAVRDLSRDMGEVTGRAPAILGEARTGCIRIGTISNPAGRALAEAAGVSASELEGKWENYVIRTADASALVIAGSDERGTIFGIYDFAARCLGVDPIANWTGLPAARKESAVVPALDVASGTPEFRFRGWFLNDEDLITGWHLSPERRRLVHYYFHLPIADEVYERVFETALRLRCNAVIPGSYIDLESAVDRKIVAAAQRRGLFVSQHHTQPLGVSAFAFRNYWHDRGKSVDFSYTARPDEMEEVWRHYAKLWARHPNVIWQLGLRGTSDRPFWTVDPNAPSGDAARGAIISRAIHKQWDIVRGVTGAPSPHATATLWAEGSSLHQKRALEFPEGVTVVFADEGSTQEMQRDFFDIPREGDRRYGVYYHAAFWGAGPRLAQGVALEKIARNYAAVAAKGDVEISILNVGSIREVILQAEAVADLTWGGVDIDPPAHLRRWCAREFGEGVADEVAVQYERYFAAFAPLPKPGAVALDGVLRFAGKDILSMALDRDSFPAGGSAELIAKLKRNADYAGRTADAFRDVIEGARAVATRIPTPRRQFFEDNLIVHAETMCGLGQWLTELSEGMRSFTRLEVREAASHAERAAAALAHVLECRKKAEWGPWKHWYRGDWRMNLPALHGDTRRLAAKWAELAVMEEEASIPRRMR